MGVRPDVSRGGAPRRGALLAGALVVGSVLAADPAGWSPFGPAKWMVVSALGFSPAGVLLWGGPGRLHGRSTVAWTVLLALFAFAASVGDDAATAIVGHPDRRLGWLTWLLFMLLFLAGQQVLDAVRPQMIVRGAALATVGVGVWSMWEVFAGPPIAVCVREQPVVGTVRIRVVPRCGVVSVAPDRGRRSV